MGRVAVALIALLLGAVAVPVVGAAQAISVEPTCREIGLEDPAEPAGSDCFSGSEIRRGAVAGLLYGAGGMAVLAMLAGAAAALRGSRGVAMALLAIVAALLFAAAVVVARVG